MCNGFKFKFNMKDSFDNMFKGLEETLNGLEDTFGNLEESLENAFSGIKFDFDFKKGHHCEKKTEANKIIINKLKEEIITTEESERLLKIINKDGSTIEDIEIIMGKLQEEKFSIEETITIFKFINKTKDIEEKATKLILNMVKDGKISIDDVEKLLRALT